MGEEGTMTLKEVLEVFIHDPVLFQTLLKKTREATDIAFAEAGLNFTVAVDGCVMRDFLCGFVVGSMLRAVRNGEVNADSKLWDEVFGPDTGGSSNGA